MLCNMIFVKLKKNHICIVKLYIFIVTSNSKQVNIKNKKKAAIIIIKIKHSTKQHRIVNNFCISFS